MKYLKYKQIDQTRKTIDKMRLSTLEKNAQKKIKKSRKLQKLITIMAFILFIVSLGFFIFLITLIPVPKSTLLGILYGLGCVILGFIALILSALIAGIPATFLLEKVNYNLPEMKKEYLAKACEDIRNYYGLTDDYLITKCFDATNSNFNNHDICIFKVNDEIRITSDIVNGFINERSNIGCYAIKLNELEFFKDDYNQKRVTILKVKNEKFIVGIRAYSYITKIIEIK